LQAYDGYKYPASAMINFLLFVRLCHFKTREEGLEFLERYKGWAIALGFNKGVPHESDVTKFVNFNEDGFELEFNVKKTKEKYYEHIESINSFVEKMREKRDILDVFSLSH
jgi:antirestriction protein